MSITEEQQHLFDQAEQATAVHQYHQAVEHYQTLLNQLAPDTADDDQRRLRFKALQESGRMLNLLGEPQRALTTYEMYAAEATTAH